MRYEVRTLTAANVVTTIAIDARDEDDVRRQCADRALSAISIRNASATRGVRLLHAKRFSLLLFSQELLALVKAGLSLFEAIEALREKEATPDVCSILDRLLTALREGRRFSAALSEQPEHFTPLYIGLMQAAEGTSELPHSLGRFVDYQRQIDGIRSKVISASVYPLILMVVGVSVTCFLLGYVVPKFSLVYHDSGRELPWLSKMMLGWGQYAADHALEVLCGLLVLVAGIVGALRHLVRKGGVAEVVSRLPALGNQARIYELSRLYITLGMLLEGGIPATSALDTASATVSASTRKSLASAASQIRDGQPLSSAFAVHGLTTTISLRMLRVGEQSGQLGAMLTQAAEFYDRDITRFVDRFTRAFEPILMVAIGAVVGVIVVLLYMPIFDLAGSIQ
ncbi:type II secretion system protein [Cupriavidus sp. USMAA2-4]|uniref:type II secretion system F family protein n=1 Tax=Cupriavidus sp. USMAA2-4 TaxID=876364 RepID=UPI0008A7190A|nr:type II secretion system F family protein [Cupriavidus sp. USMAA2-4]AOY90741.1 type II secretion system protein [Cupriavidus sp. USMAA2-4]